MSKPEETDPDETALYTEVARRIRETRLREKLTQQEVADRVGVKKSYIFELERGTANPTLRTLYRLGKALNLCASDFLPHAGRREIDEHQLKALTEHCHTMISLIKQGTDESGKIAAQQVEALHMLQRTIGQLTAEPVVTAENAS
jgi:transcriptional regulator with XRE-family HTH domain